MVTTPVSQFYIGVSLIGLRGVLTKLKKVDINKFRNPEELWKKIKIYILRFSSYFPVRKKSVYKRLNLRSRRSSLDKCTLKSFTCELLRKVLLLADISLAPFVYCSVVGDCYDQRWAPPCNFHPSLSPPAESSAGDGGAGGRTGRHRRPAQSATWLSRGRWAGRPPLGTL